MAKDFSKWHELKTKIDSKQDRIFFHSREVWWCSIGLNVGFEQDGKGSLYERPVLILKVFNLESLLVVPLSSKIKTERHYFTLDNNGDKSSANLSQIRLVSNKRLQRKIRTIPKKEFDLIKSSLAELALGIKNDPLAGISEAEAIYNPIVSQPKILSRPKQLSLEPYKGTRDFYPKEQFIQNYIFGVWKNVVESYGYLRYDASILEETDLYRAKSGEEIVSEQTYSFTDRGGRDVTIRPEMTPTVARMVAQKRKELTFPLRWYSIPNLFRYERPQRGRLREHWQLNVDMFGVESMEADLEIANIAAGIMKAFGAREEQYEIRVNSRKFLNFLLNDYLQLNQEQAHKVSKLFDRMHKISGDEFQAQLLEIVGEVDKSATLTAISRAKSLLELPEAVKAHKSAAELMVFIKKLQSQGLNNVRFEISVVRGFDYYTGIVFEVFDTNPKNPRSIFGGGRYDDLVGIFGVERVPGIGFGMGDVVIKDFLESYNLLTEYKPSTDLYIAPLDALYIDAANQLAAYLRGQGLNVAVDLTDRQVSKKVKTADKEQIPFVLVIGEQEVKSSKFKVKSFRESKEYEVGKEEIAALIKK